MKKFQFSKLILGAVMVLYFAGAVFGGFIVVNEPAALGELLAYIGAPTAVAIGFYAWKSKAENVIKIAQSVDSNRKISEKTKQQLVKGIAKTLNDIESEDYDSGA